MAHCRHMYFVSQPWLKILCVTGKHLKMSQAHAHLVCVCSPHKIQMNMTKMIIHFRDSICSTSEFGLRNDPIKQNVFTHVGGFNSNNEEHLTFHSCIILTM